MGVVGRVIRCTDTVSAWEEPRVEVAAHWAQFQHLGVTGSSPMSPPKLIPRRWTKGWQLTEQWQCQCCEILPKVFV